MKTRAIATLISLACLLTTLAATTPARAGLFPKACPTAGSKTLKNASFTVDAVSPKKIDVFKITLGAGSHNLVIISPGDIDLRVCKLTTTKTKKGLKTTGRESCYSHNGTPVQDGCAQQVPYPTTPKDLPVTLPAVVESLGQPVQFGPPLAAGTYTVSLNHCTDVDCGYPKDVPVPLPYVLVIN